MDDNRRSKLKLKEQYRPKTYTRRKAVIDMLRPLPTDQPSEGQVEHVQVFETSDNCGDMIISFQTSAGTLNWFLDRKSLREFGRRLAQL